MAMMTDEEQNMMASMQEKHSAIAATIRRGVFYSYDIFIDDNQTKWIKVQAIINMKRRFNGYTVEIMVRFLALSPNRWRLHRDQEGHWWTSAI